MSNVNTYPQIFFNETDAFPVRRTLPYRTAIGIVGEFTRGPAAAVRVTPEEYNLLYGNDGSNGSIAVRQALELGAGDLVISRAVPQDSSSVASIYVTSGNPTVVEPIVGYEVDAGEYNYTIDENNHTIGLGLTAKYIGSPVIYKHLYGTVSTKDSQLDHPFFNTVSEQALFMFTVADFRAGVSVPEIKHDDTKSIGLDVAACGAGEYQVVIIDTVDSPVNNYTDVDQAILPGYVFTFEQTAVEKKLQIVSKPFAVGTNKVGVLVKALTAVTASAGQGEVQIVDPEEDVYILAYTTNLNLNGTLTCRTADHTYFTVPDASYTDTYDSYGVDSFLALDANSIGSYINFKYLAVADDAILTAGYKLVEEGLHTDAEKGLQLLFGTLGSSGYAPLLKGGRFGVPVASAHVAVGSSNANSVNAYTPGTTFKKVIGDLFAAVTANGTFEALIRDVNPVTEFFPYRLDFTSNIVGLEANRLYLSLTRYVKGTAAEADDVYFGTSTSALQNITSPSVLIPLKGAYDGPRSGYRDIYSSDGTPILRVTALSPGPSKIKISVAPEPSIGEVAARFSLTVEATVDDKVYAESFILDANSVEGSTGLFTQTSDSLFIRAFYIPYRDGMLLDSTDPSIVSKTLAKNPVRPVPPLQTYSLNYAGGFQVVRSGSQYIANLPLEGGSDYQEGLPKATFADVRRSAYEAAVDRLANEDIAFLGVVGIDYGQREFISVFNKAIAQAKQSRPDTGLRLAFFETPLNMSSRKAKSFSDEINSSSVVLVNGHVTMQYGSKYAQRMGVVGYYIGHLATSAPQVPPHGYERINAMTSVLNADVDLLSSPDYKRDVTLGRVETIHRDAQAQAYKFLNGRTTGPEDKPTRFVTVMRIQQQILSDLLVNLTSIKSMPNTARTRQIVTTQIQTYMQTKQVEGMILKVGDVICNNTNNTADDVLNARMNIAISYVPVLPADYFYVNLKTDYSLLTLSIDTAVSPV